MAGGCDRNVGRGSAKVLSEGRDVLQIHPDVVRVDINADAPDREQFVGHGIADLSSLNSAPQQLELR
ncbi:hypothetical protein D3C84_1257930 [compost metagenome]